MLTLVVGPEVLLASNDAKQVPVPSFDSRKDACASPILSKLDIWLYQIDEQESDVTVVYVDRGEETVLAEVGREMLPIVVAVEAQYDGAIHVSVFLDATCQQLRKLGGGPNIEGIFHDVLTNFPCAHCGVLTSERLRDGYKCFWETMVKMRPTGKFLAYR